MPKVEPDSKLAKPSRSASLIRSLVVVGGTYITSAVSLGWELSNLEQAENAEPSVVMAILVALIVCLFTFTHCFLVGAVGVAIFRAGNRFFDTTLDKSTTAVQKFGGSLFFGFVTVWFGSWFGMPMLFLSVMTGGLTIAWLCFHLALTPPGHRMVGFIEHGSTSMAMLLCVVVFVTGTWQAIGLVLAFQIFLLAYIDYISDSYEFSDNWKPRTRTGLDLQRRVLADYVFRGALLAACVAILIAHQFWLGVHFLVPR